MDSVKLGNAMGKSDDPSPSEEFATFRREELLAYKSTCEKSGLLALEKILEGPLGFWMFTQWCAASNDSIDFVETVGEREREREEDESRAHVFARVSGSSEQTRS